MLFRSAYRQAVDDWRRDPQNWNPEPYMRELAKIPNRGYSLAFHDGNLSHHAHNYEDTHTFSEWEFAGMIVDVTEDAFLMTVKNRMEKGDVLEFVPPGKRETLLLRIYEFDDVHNKRKPSDAGINAGQKPLLRIPFVWFHEEDPAQLAKDFPPYTVVRKEKALTADAWARLKLDKAAQAVEMGKGSEAEYQQKRDNLVEVIKEETAGVTFRTPRLGVEGCCGRGCNGCLHFWHDDKYAKARALLKTKKQGSMLTGAEVQAAIAE